MRVLFLCSHSMFSKVKSLVFMSKIMFWFLNEFFFIMYPSFYMFMYCYVGLFYIFFLYWLLVLPCFLYSIMCSYLFFSLLHSCVAKSYVVFPSFIPFLLHVPVLLRFLLSVPVVYFLSLLHIPVLLCVLFSFPVLYFDVPGFYVLWCMCCYDHVQIIDIYGCFLFSYICLCFCWSYVTVQLLKAVSCCFSHNMFQSAAVLLSLLCSVCNLVGGFTFLSLSLSLCFN